MGNKELCLLGRRIARIVDFDYRNASTDDYPRIAKRVIELVLPGQDAAEVAKRAITDELRLYDEDNAIEACVEGDAT